MLERCRRIRLQDCAPSAKNMIQVVPSDSAVHRDCDFDVAEIVPLRQGRTAQRTLRLAAIDKR
jgi:hypothetical protein